MNKLAMDVETDSVLVQLDRAHIWHPFTQMRTARPALPIVRGEGVFLYDESGKRYIDAISSWWVNLHGHCHPYIANAIKRQTDTLEHVIFADFTHAPAVDIASRLLPLLPGDMSKLFFSDNGSTAVEVAIKMALQYWHNKDPSTPKRKILCFKGSYHGDTLGAMSAAGRNEFNRPFWSYLLQGQVIAIPQEETLAQALRELETLLQQGETACFIFEPLVLGAGGMVIYSAEILSAIMHLCQAYGVLTIADEVMTGFGRTGSLFACEQLPIAPDMICLSKGITGGFLPLGATACRQEIYDAFLGDTLQQAFLHGHSYTGNPLACSAAVASLELLTSDECTRQRTMIAESHQAFVTEWSGHAALVRCQCLGTILALEFKAESSSYFQSMRDRLYNFFMEQGILLRPLGNVVYVMPPYCITHEDLQIIYAAIATALKEHS
jgi:adenosylmethionine-8-amino-7-oxononanoate aminotransferase